MPKVLFCSKTYFGDYHKFLSGAFDRKVPPYPFDDKILMLNNGVPEGVKFPCKTLDVIPLIDQVLDFYNLKHADIAKGFWYSIAELTAIYYAKDYDYLCWVQGDSLTEGDWITPGIKILEEDKTVSAISPYSECNTWGDDWHFSDQSFLIRVKEFRNPIYEVSDVPDYPEYAGETFEKMCGNYLKKNHLTRKILHDFYQHHPAY